MKITNNGDIDGYTKSIEDKMPETLTFSSEMNSDWYKSGSSLYNTSLANTLIKPGETKELTLVLTKNMTQSNTGLTNNKAKIALSSNTQGIEDEKENEGSANVIISVSTGTLLSYVAIVIGLFLVVAIAAYLFIIQIKRK